MNRYFAVSFFCALLIVGISFAQEKPKDVKETKDSFDSVIKDMIAALKKAGETLKGAKDEKSAKEIKPALAKILDEMLKLKERGNKLSKATAEQEKDLETKFRTELDSAVSGLQREAERVAKEPWGKDLLEALKVKDAPPDKPKTPASPSKKPSP